MVQTLTPKQIYELFVHRKDVYALQTKKGSYFPKKEPITLEVIERHLRGEITVGLYCLGLDNTCKWACIDLDGSDLRQLYDEATLIYSLFPDFRRMLEFSGRRGYHVWVFPDKPMQAALLQKIVVARIRRANLNFHEIFPKQTELNEGRKYGNLVKIPLAKHKKSGLWSEIIKMEGIP